MYEDALMGRQSAHCGLRGYQGQAKLVHLAPAEGVTMHGVGIGRCSMAREAAAEIPL